MLNMLIHYCNNIYYSLRKGAIKAAHFYFFKLASITYGFSFIAYTPHPPPPSPTMDYFEQILCNFQGSVLSCAICLLD